MAMRALGFEPKKEEIKKMIADIDKVRLACAVGVGSREETHLLEGRSCTQPHALPPLPAVVVVRRRCVWVLRVGCGSPSIVSMHV